jgi:hypothetical protein
VIPTTIGPESSLDDGGFRGFAFDAAGSTQTRTPTGAFLGPEGATDSSVALLGGGGLLGKRNHRWGSHEMRIHCLYDLAEFTLTEVGIGVQRRRHISVERNVLRRLR